MVPGPYLIQRLDHGFAVGPALPGGETGEVDPRFVCQSEDDAEAARLLPEVAALLRDCLAVLNPLSGFVTYAPLSAPGERHVESIRERLRALLTPLRS